MRKSGYDIDLLCLEMGMAIKILAEAIPGNAIPKTPNELKPYTDILVSTQKLYHKMCLEIEPANLDLLLAKHFQAMRACFFDARLGMDDALSFIRLALHERYGAAFILVQAGSA